jgi:hypothetical protein
VHECHRLGQLLHDRYNASRAFISHDQVTWCYPVFGIQARLSSLPLSFLYLQLYCRSTSTDRTIMSARCVLAAMCSACSHSNGSMAFSRVGVLDESPLCLQHTLCATCIHVYEHDSVFMHARSCALTNCTQQLLKSKHFINSLVPAERTLVVDQRRRQMDWIEREFER